MSRTPVLHLSDTEGDVTTFMLLHQLRMARGVGAIEVHVDRAGGSVDVYRYAKDEPVQSLGCFTPCGCP